MKLPETSRKVLNMVSALLFTQNNKGVSKYKRTIDDAPNSEYDWNVMLSEELIDALQYSIKENQRLIKEMEMMKSLLILEINTESNRCERFGQSQMCDGLDRAIVLLSNLKVGVENGKVFCVDNDGE